MLKPIKTPKLFIIKPKYILGKGSKKKLEFSNFVGDNIKNSQFLKKNLYCVGAGTPMSLATQPTLGGGESCCKLEIGQNLILDHDV